MKFMSIFLLILLIGCSGRHCISVGGTYEGVDGNVEYCYDAKDSKANKTPTFNDEKEEKHFLLDESFIKKINDKIKEKFGFSIKTTEIKEENQPVRNPILELKNLIGKD